MPTTESEAAAALTAFGSGSIFIAIDGTLRGAFARGRFNFPSSLAGLALVCGSLLSLDAVDASSADAALRVLSPGADAFATWLPLFFVPSLVALPLQRTPAVIDAAKLGNFTRSDCVWVDVFLLKII